MNKEIKDFNENKTCYNCVNFGLCFFRHKVNDVLHASLFMFDTDRQNPNVISWQFIYIAIANACLKYSKNNNE